MSNRAQSVSQLFFVVVKRKRLFIRISSEKNRLASKNKF